jgi:hypothetical protein
MWLTRARMAGRYQRAAALPLVWAHPRAHGWQFSRATICRLTKGSPARAWLAGWYGRPHHPLNRLTRARMAGSRTKSEADHTFAAHPRAHGWQGASGFLEHKGQGTGGETAVIC